MCQHDLAASRSRNLSRLTGTGSVPRASASRSPRGLLNGSWPRLVRASPACGCARRCSVPFYTVGRARWLWQRNARHGTTSGRTGRQLPGRAQPVCNGARPQAPCMRGGVCVSPPAQAPRRGYDRHVVARRPPAKLARPGRCRRPPGRPATRAVHAFTNTSMRRPSARGTSIVMSRSMTLVATRAPASRQARATALSNAAPRGPKTPAIGHAVWWSPKASGTPPHRHCRGPTTGCFCPESGGVSLPSPCSQGTHVPTGYSFRICRRCPRPLGRGGRAAASPSCTGTAARQAKKAREKKKTLELLLASRVAQTVAAARAIGSPAPRAV